MGQQSSPSELRSKSIHFTQTSIGAYPVEVKEGGEELREQRKGKWHVNAMGSVIYKEHDSYDLMRQIQMGIRISVSEVTPKKGRYLTQKDFVQIEKLNFPNAGTQRTPPHDHPPFVFYDYASLCFKQLRERFGIDAAHFLLSVCHDKSLSILGTPGKSGALFFFSQDMKYILKTVTKKESKFLRKILPYYYNHVMANPSTLIARFYGLYSIKPTGQLSGHNVRFIVMNNVFDTQKDVLYRYDIKGSTVGREASPKERSRPRPVLKDLDFLNEGRKIRVGQKLKSIIIEQLKSDCHFLESMKIMDYSLLLGIHTFPESKLQEYLNEMVDNNQKSEAIAGTSTVDASLAELSIKYDSNVNNSVDTCDETTGITVFSENRPASDTQASIPQQAEIPRQQSLPELNVQRSDISTDQLNSERTMSVKTEASSSTTDVPTMSAPSRKKFALLQRPRLSLSKKSTGNIFSPQIQLEKPFQGEDQSKFQKFHGGLLSPSPSPDGMRDVYFIGIIDILQKWNNKKQLENIVKGMKYDKTKISSVNPRSYAARFCDFIEKSME